MAAQGEEVCEGRTKPQHNWLHISVIKKVQNLVSLKRGKRRLKAFSAFGRNSLPTNVGNFFQLIRSWATSWSLGWTKYCTGGIVSCCGCFGVVGSAKFVFASACSVGPTRRQSVLTRKIFCLLLTYHEKCHCPSKFVVHCPHIL